ncbi:hypothetical protein GH714_001787 [Hevea brasiliensis]|uniref:SET domain-containing protein n=1 Tax=Hevea brasiliensis TaxID=3981 RepID=A0A6A6KQ79_HEVBR|nr:hypothetical protein GH714_001787 [Hevea brasiliensis]
MQELRLKANELLLREEWQESVQVYTQFIDLCQEQSSNTNQHYPNTDQINKLQKSLCLALSNRAEARSRLKDFTEALEDCDQALKIETTHFKALLCKGKILLCLNRTGAFDLSDWVLNGFRGSFPELAEYIGPVEIKQSQLSGRGLFAAKNIDAGTLLLVNKAIATERGILSSEDSNENAQLMMWKNFIDEVVESTKKCRRIQHLVSTLSTGEEEEKLGVPEMSLFRQEAEEISSKSNEELDMVRMMSILDVNSLVEDSVSASVLGKNKDYYGVGLDVKAGEEITFAYFDVLLPMEKRREMSNTWGFHCHCKRCKFEQFCSKQEMKEIEMGLERGLEVGGAIFRLEEGMKRWMVRGKEKGYLRASFWPSYCEAYGSEKLMKRWGRRLPALDVVVDSVAEATGSDERVVKVLLMGGLRRTANVVEMERVMKLGRGIYGKVVKKQAMKSLLQHEVHGLSGC